MERCVGAIQASFNNLHQILEERKIKLLKEMMTQLQQVVAEEERGKLSRRDRASLLKADLGVEVKSAKNLRDLCLSSTRITQLVQGAPKYEVRGKGKEVAEVNHAAEITLTTSAKKKADADVVGKLTSLKDGSVIVCGVDKLGPGAAVTS